MNIQRCTMLKLIKDYIYFFKPGKIDRYDNKQNLMINRITFNSAIIIETFHCFNNFYLYIGADWIYFTDIMSFEQIQFNAKEKILD
jgi:hypothetical protein